MTCLEFPWTMLKPIVNIYYKTLLARLSYLIRSGYPLQTVNIQARITNAFAHILDMSVTKHVKFDTAADCVLTFEIRFTLFDQIVQHI